jgi:hypothetical protein
MRWSRNCISTNYDGPLRGGHRSARRYGWNAPMYGSAPVYMVDPCIVNPRMVGAYILGQCMVECRPTSRIRDVIDVCDQLDVGVLSSRMIADALRPEKHDVLGGTKQKFL